MIDILTDVKAYFGSAQENVFPDEQYGLVVRVRKVQVFYDNSRLFLCLSKHRMVCRILRKVTAKDITDDTG